MKFSTGKRARLKHSTGLDMDKLKELKKKRRKIKHSTGGSSSLSHSSGKESDYKVELEELLENESEDKGE